MKVITVLTYSRHEGNDSLEKFIEEVIDLLNETVDNEAVTADGIEVRIETTELTVGKG